MWLGWIWTPQWLSFARAWIFWWFLGQGNIPGLFISHISELVGWDFSLRLLHPLFHLATDFSFNFNSWVPDLAPILHFLVLFFFSTYNFVFLFILLTLFYYRSWREWLVITKWYSHLSVMKSLLKSLAPKSSSYSFKFLRQVQKDPHFLPKYYKNCLWDAYQCCFFLKSLDIDAYSPHCLRSIVFLAATRMSCYAFLKGSPEVFHVFPNHNMVRPIMARPDPWY